MASDISGWDDQPGFSALRSLREGSTSVLATPNHYHHPEKDLCVLDIQGKVEFVM